jgi:pyruvate formate lyase activating enzyme
MFEATLAQETGIIFDIQRYSIHDGPGIRTTVFLKGCSLRCPWCANPESQRLMPEIEHFRGRCLHCYHCVDICPTAAITESNGEVQLNRDACNMCGGCWEECLAEAMKVTGRKATVGEILSIVERDRLFYQRTGGGVTLSGGEPAAQPAFCAALLRACKSRGLHTAIQTTAHQSWELLSPIIADTDLVLLDIKIMDRALHQEMVGVPSDLILANAKRIAEDTKTAVIIRIPVIPGYNVSVDDLQGIVDFASRIGVREVHLLPYHRLGEPKYHRLGRKYELSGQSAPSDDYCRELLDRLRKHDLVVRIGG